MSLKPSRDEFNAKLDLILRDAVGLTNYTYQVDDILIWGNTQEELDSQIEAFLNACRLNNVTLSPKKTMFALGEEETLNFGRKSIGYKGCGPSDDRLKALADMPVPTCKKEVQSLISLTSQFGMWYLELAGLTSEIKKVIMQGC